MFFRPFSPLLCAFTAALLVLGVSSSPAQEFWIEAQEYQVESGVPLLAGSVRDPQNRELEWETLWAALTSAVPG